MSFKKKEKKIFLITGGAGYIGSHLANLLLDNNYNVIVIDNLSRGRLELVPKKSIFFKCGIDDENQISKILNRYRIDLVFHLAGYKDVTESNKFPKKYFINNYHKSKKFIDTCIKYNLKKIIFSSSASVYGNMEKREIRENDKVCPISVYGKTKLKFEKYLIKNKKKNKLKYIILRYFNVAGSEKKLRSGLISKNSKNLIQNIIDVLNKKKKKFVINGNQHKTFDGTTIRDFIHVVDLVNIHYLMMKYLLKSNKSNIFNCGYGKGFSVLDVLSIANKISKKKLNIKIGKKRKNDIIQSVANIDKLKKYIKWKPRNNDLKEIIYSSLKWEKKLVNLNK